MVEGNKNSGLVPCFLIVGKKKGSISKEKKEASLVEDRAIKEEIIRF